jgi:hypothetical protein
MMVLPWMMVAALVLVVSAVVILVVMIVTENSMRIFVQLLTNDGSAPRLTLQTSCPSVLLRQAAPRLVAAVDGDIRRRMLSARVPRNAITNGLSEVASLL